MSSMIGIIFSIGGVIGTSRHTSDLRSRRELTASRACHWGRNHHIFNMALDISLQRAIRCCHSNNTSPRWAKGSGPEDLAHAASDRSLGLGGSTAPTRSVSFTCVRSATSRSNHLRLGQRHNYLHTCGLCSMLDLLHHLDSLACDEAVESGGANFPAQSSVQKAKRSCNTVSLVPSYAHLASPLNQIESLCSQDFRTSSSW